MTALAIDRTAYVSITNRQRAFTFTGVALLYVLALLLILIWPDSPPGSIARDEREVVSFIPLPQPPEPVVSRPKLPSADVPRAAAGMPKTAVLRPDTPAPAPQIAPPSQASFDVTPVPAAPVAPTQAGGPAVRDGSGAGVDGARSGGGIGGAGGGLGAGNGGGGGATATRAAWARQPSWEEIYEFHPQRAKSAKISGSAMLVCRATLKRRLKECRVTGETPVGWSFGRAALDLAPTLRVLPRRENGIEIDHGMVYFTIRFDMPIEAPR